MRYLLKILIATAWALILFFPHASAQEGSLPLGERLGHRTEALMEMSRIGQVYQSTDLLSYDIAYDFADSAARSTVLEHKSGKYGLYNNLFWGKIDTTMEYLQGQQYYVVADHEMKTIYVYDKLNYARVINVPLLDSLFNEVSLKDLILTRPGGIDKKLTIQYLPDGQYKQIEMVYDSVTYLLKSIAYYYNAAIYSQAYNNCQDSITVLPVPSTGVAMPATVTCASLVSTYQHFIAEFPNHTKGATVRVRLPGGWVDSAMNAMPLFEWYMNMHLGVQYTGEVYADWLVNTCAYKLYQLPWNETTIVRQDTLQNIWNRFVARYPGTQTAITETVSIPVIKGLLSMSNWSTDNYYAEYLWATTWTDGPWYTGRAVNTYDLSVLPKNASIQSAYLSLYAYNPPWSHAAHFRFVSQSPFLQIQQVKGLYIPGRSTFTTQPEYYAGVPSVNLAPVSTDQVPGGSSDFWSNQHYPNQNVGSLITAMYSNMLTTGVNYPVQYKLNDETAAYKKYNFGGTGSADISKRPVLNVTYSASRCEVLTAFVNRALGTYMNYSDVVALFKYAGKLDISSDCTSAAPGAGCEGDPGPGRPITGVTTISFTKTDETALDLDLFNESRFFYKVGDTFHPQSIFSGYTIFPVFSNNQ